MIGFSCKSCGKKHSRSDGEGGTLIFCSCGASVRVPFSDSAPPEPPVAVPVPRRVPDAIPVPSPARVVPVAIPDALPVETVPLPPSDGPALRRPERRYRKLDPNTCWHHEDDASSGRCAACHLPFCAACLVGLRGQSLCGPCKNFRVGGAGQPARVLSLAVMSLVASLVAAPVAFALSLVGAGLFLGDGTAGAAVLLAALGLVPAAAALGTSVWALWKLEGQTRLSGRATAC
ncbi:MAG: hypothetical protein ACRC33_19200, partial [Gemmataceae bacterium]